MSDKKLLRKTRANTVINSISKGQEKEVISALKIVADKIAQKFPNIKLEHQSTMSLKYVVEHLKSQFPDIDFYYKFDSSFMSPDGGFLCIVNKTGEKYPILIPEVKNQGTNDLRINEGLKKQPKGNAIERLGKNVIGLRTYFLTENIFPFVCFGYGCDFDDTSSILDRVITIAMFGKLNKTYLHNEQQFNRGSFYFRRNKWSIEEMVNIMYDIAEKSIFYYFSKYGESIFNIK
ncbi:MAG: hypothetical protein IJL05_02470 [Alphaproteobacteria bacterium]|nr:hypothetical protein [Alphaproteobacteria bacterium]